MLEGIEAQKKRAGIAATKYVHSGMVVGLGTGSTVYYVIMELAKMVRKHSLDIVCIPTSRSTSSLARREGLTLSTLKEHPRVDLTIDGADEVAPDLTLVKGGGGALLWEKIVASKSNVEIIVVDEKKMVTRLGTTMPLPVEVDVFASSSLHGKLEGLGAHPTLRMAGKSPFITDSGNHIIDLKFNSLENPVQLEKEINNIPGVLENGLFIGLTNRVIIGCEDGTRELVAPFGTDEMKKVNK